MKKPAHKLARLATAGVPFYLPDGWNGKWVPGKTVICKRDEFTEKWKNAPVAGERYTIRGVKPCTNGSGIGLILNGIENEMEQFRDGYYEPSFDSSGFELVDACGGRDDGG